MVHVKQLPKGFRWVLAGGSLLLFLGLVFLCRTANWPAIFHDDGVYFVDADCYSRMTRAEMVFHGAAVSIREHDFENWPEGTKPHTTAPLDLVIAVFAWILKLGYGAAALDYSGAWIGPLLSLATAGFLWFWARAVNFPNSWMLFLLFAVNPILTLAGTLGRPDHQVLQILFLTFFLAAQWVLFGRSSKAWSIVAGGSLGFALWVSLYEPLVLAAAMLVLELFFNRPRLFQRERMAGLYGLAGVLLVALLVDGVRWSPPQMSGPFEIWARQIGELNRAALPVLLSWGLPAAVAAAAGLVWLAIKKRDARSLAFLLLWLLILALSIWQQRWGYFFGLATAFVVPMGLAALRWRWLAWLGLVLLLWPVWQNWDATWFPRKEQKLALQEQQQDDLMLRDAALFLKENGGAGDAVIAPWWLAPRVRYWSGLPCVAGSSHQSLPGILDTARFYLATEPREAEALLRRRQVRWVLSYEPSRVLQTAAPLAGIPPMRGAMGLVLYERPALPPPFLEFRYANRYFRLHRLRDQ